MADSGVSFLNIVGGKVIVCSDREDLEGRLILEPGSPFEMNDRSHFLRGINLLLDDTSTLSKASTGPADCWDIRGSKPGRPDILGKPGGDTSGLVRRVDVPIDPARPTATYVVYVDPEWGDLIPIVEDARYVFSSRIRVEDCNVLLRVEFYDNRKFKIAESVVDSPAVASTGFSEHDVRTPEFIVPPKSQYVKCLLVCRPSKGVANNTGTLQFTQAMLIAQPATNQHQWIARPEEFTPYYSFLNARSKVIYSASITDRTRTVVGANIPILLDGKVVLEIELPKIKYPVLFELNIAGVKDISVVFSVKHINGILTVYIDKQFVRSYQISAHNTPVKFAFSLPDQLLDGEVHLVEVRDEFGVQSLAMDFLSFPNALVPWAVIQRNSMPPHPGHLSPAASEHLRSFEASMSYIAGLKSPTDSDKWLIRSIPEIYKTLVAGFENNSKFYSLDFPVYEKPVVSIVIPVHNKYATTFHCLCALLFARNVTSFEVIVADDGSTDETADELLLHKGITVVTNSTAEGFIGACKAGAAMARGEFILFLNNDTEPTAGWLDELVKCFDVFENVGAAASQLLYPDGRLQDAGGIIWRSGNPWNYGRRANPHEPKYGYSRDADYVSGAALITPRSLWEEIGGFPDELRPAYFEDTWYSFAVREKGYRTIYCATSKVYHFEGISNGRDVKTTTGLKRFQEINRPKFKRRWVKAFQNFGEEGTLPDLEKDRGVQGRVLFVDWQYPRPDIDAGSFAAIQEMRLARALGLKVSFFPLNLAFMGRYTQDLNRLGIETIHAPFALSLDGFLSSRGREFDAVYITRYNVAEQALPVIKEHAPQAKVLFCLADLHFLRELRMAIRAGDKDAEVRAFELRERELEVVKQSDVVLSYSNIEIAILEGLLGSQAKVQLAPWVQTVVEESAAFENRSGMVFLGSFKHPPNLEAMQLFARDVLPDLRTIFPDLTLHVYGNGGKESLADVKEPSLCAEGFAPDLKEMFARHRIFVAPLATGAGIKGKVISAMAHGIPTILSPAALEGIGAVHEHSCLMASTKEEWLECIKRLNEDAALWSKISKNASNLVAEKFSFEAGLKVMSSAFESVEMYL